MYIKDGIAYAGEPEKTINVKSIRPLDDFKLWVRFNNDETKVFDFVPLLTSPAFTPLQNKSVFDKAYVDYGVVVWNNGAIDIAPETLYEGGVADAASACL